MTLRAIHNDDDHASAMAEIGRLWDTEPGTPEHDELEVLGVLVASYEEKRRPFPDADPVEAIKFRMEQSDFTQADLARTIGSVSRASEILRRKRHLTLEMIGKLNREWHIPAESLIKPYKLDVD
jgi:HTH-type transcriptional regulator/antitoxin HigA